METKRIVGMLLHGGANEQGLKMSAEDSAARITDVYLNK